MYTSRLGIKTQPWLADHIIYGTWVVPGAPRLLCSPVETPAQVQDVFFYEPILLADKDSRELQLTLQSNDGQGLMFQVHSRPYGDREAEWSLNAKGSVVTGVEDEPAPDPTDTADSLDVVLERLYGVSPQLLYYVFVEKDLRPWARLALIAEVAVGW